VTRFDDQPITAGAVKRGLVVERVEGGAPPAGAPAAEPAAGPASTRP